MDNDGDQLCDSFDPDDDNDGIEDWEDPCRLLAGTAVVAGCDDDVDGDGIQEDGEPGIGGVTVNLYDSGNSLIDSTVTAADGSYEFNELSDGGTEVLYALKVEPA